MFTPKSSRSPRLEHQIASIMPTSVSVCLERRHLLWCCLRCKFDSERYECRRQDESHLIGRHISSWAAPRSYTERHKHLPTLGAMFVLDEPASRVVGIEVGEEIGALTRHAKRLCSHNSTGREVIIKDVDTSSGDEA